MTAAICIGSLLAASSALAAPATPRAWLGVPLSQWLAWLAWLVVGFGLIYMLVVAYVVLAERKLAGRFQDRIGPNRVGPFGLLQPIADVVKLITKEDLVPRSADRLVHVLAPVLLLVSAFLVMAVVPVGIGTAQRDPLTGQATGRVTGLVAVDLPAGLLYLIAVSSIASLGIFLAGWSSRNKYSLLGAMRGVAQLVSYEVPQVLAAVPVILWTGSLGLVDILNHQLATGVWNVFLPPGALAFLLLTIANIAEVNRTPFDLPEAESELIAGYHTEYSGMRFGLFFLAEYFSIFALACLSTVLFLGGGSLPFTRFPAGWLEGSVLLVLLANLISIAVFAAKVALYIFVVFWIRATLPRLRVDQLMSFAWKWMIPLCVANLLIAAVWYELAVRPAAPRYLVAWIVTAALVVPSVMLVNRLHRGLSIGPVPGPRPALRSRPVKPARRAGSAAP